MRKVIFQVRKTYENLLFRYLSQCLFPLVFLRCILSSLEPGFLQLSMCAPISSSRSVAVSPLTPGLSRGGRNVESEPGPGRPCLVQTVTFPQSSANRKPPWETLRPMKRPGSPDPGHYLLFAALLPSPAGLRYQ